MAKIFVAGSRKLSRLNSALTAKLGQFMNRKDEFLIGDASGADKAVQAFLARSAYRAVVIYCVEACRNNLGSWPVRYIESRAARKGFAFYAAKDAAMARDADCGFMLWDGKSKGTLNNMEALVGMGKRTLVYLSPQKRFFTLASAGDLEELLALCDASAITQARGEIRRKLGGAAQMNLSV